MTLGLKEQLPTSISSRSVPLLQAWVTKLEKGAWAERERKTETEWRDRGGLAHGHGEGGGCSSIMTDSSTDVAIRAQSKHINDQPMATFH